VRRRRLGFWFRLAVVIAKPWVTLLTRRLSRFPAQDSLFQLPIVGRIVCGTGQIPVLRCTECAFDAPPSGIAALGRQTPPVTVLDRRPVTRDTRRSA